ncbi:MAG TPA: hypothetical protein VMH04_20950 [Candidatus Solibacter sp.]|nr:hypothetical protein [Candidatus Solibacter sp.]
MRQITTTTCLLLASFAAARSQAAKGPDLLAYSIVGSTGDATTPATNATYAMYGHPEVQQLLLDVAAKPRDRAYVEAALRGSDISLDDMVQNGSFRLEAGVYKLNLSLLTRADQEIVRRATDKYSQALAEAVLARRKKIEAALRNYDVPTVEKGAVAFIVLGCFSLDWNGLDLSEKRGYIAAPPKRSGGGQFSVMAEELGGLSLKQIYWGSYTWTAGKYQVTVFGDHFGHSKEMTLTPALQSLGESLWERIGDVLFALRDGPRTAEELTAATKLPSATMLELLAGMEEVEDIRRENGQYFAITPVLTIRDQKMVAELMLLGRDAIKEWLDKDYEPFRESVKDISPLRAGVPFPEVFAQLWHYVFGIANQKLVEAELFPDPYATSHVQKGHYVAVYDPAILEPR